MDSKKNKFNDSELASKYKELTSRYINESTKIWEKYLNLLSQVSQGKTKGANFQQKVSEFSRTEATDFINNLMKLNLNYYSVLMDLSMDFTNRLVENLTQTSESQAQARPTEPPPPPPEKSKIKLTGRKGEVLTAYFVIENRKNVATDISFNVSPLVSQDQKYEVKPSIEFEPEKFTLQPGSEQSVSVRLKITDKFRVNNTYLGTIGVEGLPGMEMELVVQVLSKKEGDPSAKAKPASGKTGKKSGGSKSRSKKKT